MAAAAAAAAAPTVEEAVTEVEGAETLVVENTSSKMEEVEVKIGAAVEGEDEVDSIDDDDDGGKDTIGDRGDGGAGEAEKGAVNEDGVGVVGFGVEVRDEVLDSVF